MNTAQAGAKKARRQRRFGRFPQESSAVDERNGAMDAVDARGVGRANGRYNEFSRTFDLMGAIMVKKDQHVIPSSGSWAVRRSGAEPASRLFATQGEAVQYARGVAQKEHAALYIHKKDGKVMSKDSYAKPSGSPKDKK